MRRRGRAAAEGTRSIERQIADLDRKVLRLARNDAQVRRFMTAPGVGAITALCFLATIDDPTRFKEVEKRRSLCRTDDPTIRLWRSRLDRPNLEMRRQTPAKLPLRGCQCAAHPRSGRRSKPGAFGLRSEAGCAKPRLPSPESLPSFCTGCGSMEPNSNGQRRLLINLHSRTTEFPPTSGNQRPCRDAGVGAIAPGFAMLKRAKRASHIDPPASSYAIMRTGKSLSRREPWTRRGC
jgi:Transposase IS116/IS110/IS902 family